jgi:Uma2 family endonuclease
MKTYQIPPEEEVSQFNDLDLSATYSYANYLKWTFNERLELIKGKIFKMSPAPARIHQKVSWEMSKELSKYLEGKNCEAYAAPFDVRLPRKSKASSSVTVTPLKLRESEVLGSMKDKDIITVVQPDICVICDPSKLDDRGCIGAPDIVVEILSPGNSKKELRNKYEVYEESGVKEYWIVWPEHKTFMKYALDDKGKYQPSRVMTLGDEVTTPVLPGFVLRLDDVFKD